MATAIPTNTASFTLEQIAAATGGRVEAAHAGIAVSGVVTDSRNVQPGQLYVALRGGRFDGHAFLMQAHAQGAVAALVDDASGAPDGLLVVIVADTRRALGELAREHRTRWGGKLVAITGSAGKTTTKELTAAALRGLGQKVLSTVGNLNNDIGLPMTLLCLTAAHSVAVVEIGTSGPGEIAWLAHVARPEVGVVTTVALAHVERLRSLEEVADEKSALLRALPADGAAIYGDDSPELRARKPSFAGASVLGFGSAATAQLQLVATALRDDLGMGVTYRTTSDGVEHSFELAICGAGAALDALAALGVVHALHGPDAVPLAARRLHDVTPLPGRMRPRAGAQHALVVDDTYNANPASTLLSLQTLRELARVRGGRAIAALADMAELGDHSQREHERIGREVVELGLSDVFFCGREMAHAARVARAQVKKQRAKGPHVTHVLDPLACVSELTRLLDARAAVLVKGSRSMAMERVVEALCPAEGDAA